MKLQGQFDWREYADTPHQFLAKLDKAEFIPATEEEKKRGIVAHIKLPKKNIRRPRVAQSVDEKQGQKLLIQLHVELRQAISTSIDLLNVIDEPANLVNILGTIATETNDILKKRVERENK